MIFVCENNFYSVYTNLKPRQPTNRNFVDVAKAIGLDVLDFKDDGILDIFDNLKNVTQSVRKKSGPVFLNFDVYRYLEHCGPNNDDDLLYRSKKEIDYWKRKDPIEQFEKDLLSMDLMNKEFKDNYIKKISKEITCL